MGQCSVSTVVPVECSQCRCCADSTLSRNGYVIEVAAGDDDNLRRNVLPLFEGSLSRTCENDKALVPAEISGKPSGPRLDFIRVSASLEATVAQGIEEATNNTNFDEPFIAFSEKRSSGLFSTASTSYSSFRDGQTRSVSRPMSEGGQPRSVSRPMSEAFFSNVPAEGENFEAFYANARGVTLDTDEAKIFAPCVEEAKPHSGRSDAHEDAVVARVLDSKDAAEDTDGMPSASESISKKSSVPVLEAELPIVENEGRSRGSESLEPRENVDDEGPQVLETGSAPDSKVLADDDKTGVMCNDLPPSPEVQGESETRFFGDDLETGQAATSMGNLEEGESSDLEDDDFEVGDIVILDHGAPREYYNHAAIITEVAENHCTVIVLDESRRHGIGECWPNFEHVILDSIGLRLGTRVVVGGLQNARTQHLNGQTGNIGKHPRKGHPNFITKASCPDTPQLTVCVFFDDGSPKERSALLEPRFLMPWQDASEQMTRELTETAMLLEAGVKRKRTSPRSSRRSRNSKGSDSRRNSLGSRESATKMSPGSPQTTAPSDRCKVENNRGDDSNHGAVDADDLNVSEDYVRQLSPLYAEE